MAEKPTIAIAGCGYVGLTTAAILAHCGYRVYALEPLAERLDVIKSGRSFFYEAGLDELIATGLKEGNLIPTDSYQAAIPDSQIVFCCMGTPDNPDGSSNLSYVFGAVEETAAHLQPDGIFVQKSTVPVGTGDRIKAVFANAGKAVRYVSNPEFLREGTAILDTLWTDRIVAGGDDRKAVEAILALYRDIEAAQHNLARIAHLTPPANAEATRYIALGQNAAELVKVSANAFLALKISFANSIAKLADQTNADITEVMAAVGADARIGAAFLNAGRGYGGGCFPKDVSGLIRSAEEYGVDMRIMDAASDLNASMPHYLIQKVERLAGTPQPLHGSRVAVLGLAFKAGTSDTRRSPAIAIANTVADMGAQVTAYDPKAMTEAKPELADNIVLADSVDEALDQAEWIFVATDWPDFLQLDFAQLKADNPHLVGIADGMNRLDPTAIKAAGLTYVGIGRS